MSSRFTSLTGLILAFYLFQGCSSPESKERLDTALCWLRPSCLPSQPPGAKVPTTPAASKPSPAQRKAKATQPIPLAKTPAKLAASKRSLALEKAKATQQVPRQNPPAKKCSAPEKTTIQISKSDIKITYNEPTTKADGKPLDNLDKTTIYYDLGKGEVKHKECIASNPQGGGPIEEIISFMISEGESLQAKICVTATNAPAKVGEVGEEGPRICKTIKK